MDSVEVQQRVPGGLCGGTLGYRLARQGGIALAVGLDAFEDVIAPLDVVLEQQVGKVRPRVDR
jgi:hypothetical protein